MEGVGVAANLIAVIDSGLKLAKTIYQTIQGMRDALKNCDKILKKLSNLTGVLQQIYDLARRNEKHDFFLNFKHHLPICVKDLRAIQDRILELRPDPSQPFLERT